jgi:hypothetical protein
MTDFANEFAGVVQWQNGSFPSCIRGFDSLRPLQFRNDIESIDVKSSGTDRTSAGHSRLLKAGQDMLLGWRVITSVSVGRQTIIGLMIVRILRPWLCALSLSTAACSRRRTCAISCAAACQ